MSNNKYKIFAENCDFLTVKQTSSILQTWLIKTYELIKQGIIPSIKLGKSIRIPRKALEQWTEQQVQQSVLNKS